MKAKVLKTFKDKKTKEIYKAGTEITLTDARYKEIKKAGDFVEEVKEAKAEPKEAKAETKKAGKAETGDK